MLKGYLEQVSRALTEYNIGDNKKMKWHLINEVSEGNWSGK